MINNYNDAIRALGIQEGASQEQVKDAFRSLSKKYHPDLYKGDNGESFKHINQAYQYLKNYQDSPSSHTIYQQKEYYGKNNTSQPYTSERAQRTARNRARQAEKNRQREAYYQRLFKLLNPYILFVLILNCLLALDYLLPRIEKTTTISDIKKTYNQFKNGDKGILTIEFKSGDKVHLYGDTNLSPSQLNHVYTYKKTLLFRQQMYLYNEDIAYKYKVGFNVIKVFGFIIIIQLLALWRYYASKDSEVKLNAVVVMGFCIILQLFLLFAR